MPPTMSTTVAENQGMKPNLLRYAAMAMRAANQVRVSQAALLFRHSFQDTTPVVGEGGWEGGGKGEGH
jgi:hypothetical protein